jgi:hypothetical protein
MFKLGGPMSGQLQLQALPASTQVGRKLANAGDGTNAPLASCAK